MLSGHWLSPDASLNWAGRVLLHDDAGCELTSVTSNCVQHDVSV